MSGIYIHIPFCKQACHYCDFHFSTSLKHKDALIDSIVGEIDQRAENWKSEKFETIYFGGGTPSIVPVADIEKILTKLRQNFQIDNRAEVTLEANPDDLSGEKLQAYRHIGINRLSIGVQSFFDEDLQKLNRSHQARQAVEAIQQAQTAGIDNITIDLIYGIPGLTDKKWEQNIQTALDLQIPHISAYALTVEPQTALAWLIKKEKYPPVSEEQSACQFEILQRKLQENNFIHYEISNFGKEDYFSRHNMSYWKNIPYLGLGPAAHSYNGKQRRWNIANNAKYIKGMDAKNYFETEDLSPQDIYNELIMTGLRTIWGVDLQKIRLLGEDFIEYLDKNAQKYIGKSLFIEENHLKARPESLFLIEGVISDLFWVD